MATSTLKIYKNMPFTEDENYLVDSFSTYLTGHSEQTTISKFQYIKHNLQIQIRVDASQSGLSYFDGDSNLYVSIQNSTDTKPIYYFVESLVWKSQETIQFNLKMDVLNTFGYSFISSLPSNRTKILRQHKDRYVAETKTKTETLSQVVEGDGTSIYLFYLENNADDDFSFDIPANTTIVSYTPVGNALSVSVKNDLHISRTIQVSVSYTYIYVRRNIDKYSEGFNPVLYKNDEAVLYDSDGTRKWYLAYINNNAVVQSPNETSAVYVNPVKLLLFPSSEITLSTQSATYVRKYASDRLKIWGESEMYYLNYLMMTKLDEDVANAKIRISGVDYTIVADGNGDSITHKAVCIALFTRYDTSEQFHIRIYYSDDIDVFDELNVSSVEFYGINQIPVLAQYITGQPSNFFPNYMLQYHPSRELGYRNLWSIGSSAQSLTGTIASIDSLDFTNPKLIKVIELPYSPIDDLRGKSTITAIPYNLVLNGDFNTFEIIDTKQFAFNSIIEFEGIKNYIDVFDNIRLTTIANADDTKMYHSEFSYYQFVYDSFTFTYQAELLDANRIFESQHPYFTCEYVVSQNLASKFMFRFNDYITTGYDLQNYNNVLLVDRNNEKAIYNNSYINYIRNGLQFDNAKMRAQNTKNALGIGLSAIGAIASFIAIPFTAGTSAPMGAMMAMSAIGMTTSAVAQSTNAIMSASQSERNIAEKQQQYANQSESISTIEDLDLLNAYADGNKAKIVRWHPSEIMYDMINHHFKMYGYADNVYGIPSMDSRTSFDFAQFQTKISNDKKMSKEMIVELTNKYANGIYRIHYFNGNWDWQLNNNNIEASIYAIM